MVLHVLVICSFVLGTLNVNIPFEIRFAEKLLKQYLRQLGMGEDAPRLHATTVRGVSFRFSFHFCWSKRKIRSCCCVWFVF